MKKQNSLKGICDCLLTLVSSVGRGDKVIIVLYTSYGIERRCSEADARQQGHFPKKHKARLNGQHREPVSSQQVLKQSAHHQQYPFF
jgi:hypothetical protein